MRKRIAIALYSVFVGSVFLFTSADAQFITAPTGPTTGAAVVALIENLTNWLFIGFLLLATIFILLAAFQYLTGGGDPTQTSAARKKLIYAVGAVIIATLAKGFVAVARSILGV